MTRGGLKNINPLEGNADECIHNSRLVDSPLHYYFYIVLEEREYRCSMRRHCTRTLLSLLQRVEGSSGACCVGGVSPIANGARRDTFDTCMLWVSKLGGVCSYSTKELEFGCWRCGHKDPSLYTCHKCGTIQPPKECLDAYALFGLKKGEYKFDIPLDELEHNYKKLQRMMHPDKFSTASDEEKHFSAEQAALINRAYATLKDPLSRGSHLLSLLTEQDEDEGEHLSLLFSVFPQNSFFKCAVMNLGACRVESSRVE